MQIFKAVIPSYSDSIFECGNTDLAEVVKFSGKFVSILFDHCIGNFSLIRVHVFSLKSERCKAEKIPPTFDDFHFSTWFFKFCSPSFATQDDSS